MLNMDILVIGRGRMSNRAGDFSLVSDVEVDPEMIPNMTHFDAAQDRASKNGLQMPFLKCDALGASNLVHISKRMKASGLENPMMVIGNDRFNNINFAFIEGKDLSSPNDATTLEDGEIKQLKREAGERGIITNKLVFDRAGAESLQAAAAHMMLSMDPEVESCWLAGEAEYEARSCQGQLPLLGDPTNNAPTLDSEIPDLANATITEIDRGPLPPGMYSP